MDLLVYMRLCPQALPSTVTDRTTFVDPRPHHRRESNLPADAGVATQAHTDKTLVKLPREFISIVHTVGMHDMSAKIQKYQAMRRMQRLLQR